MPSAPVGVLPISICYISAHARCSGRIKSDQFMRSTGSGFRLELRGICLLLAAPLPGLGLGRVDDTDAHGHADHDAGIGPSDDGRLPAVGQQSTIRPLSREDGLGFARLSLWSYHR